MEPNIHLIYYRAGFNEKITSWAMPSYLLIQWRKQVPSNDFIFNLLISHSQPSLTFRGWAGDSEMNWGQLRYGTEITYYRGGLKPKYATEI